MSSPFSKQDAQVAPRLSNGGSKLPDFEKPVTDVYRTNTLSDVGLWIADTLSPGKNGGGISSMWTKLWSAPSFKAPAASTGGASTSASGACKDGICAVPSTFAPSTPSSSSTRMDQNPGNSWGSWGAWLTGRKA